MILTTSVLSRLLASKSSILTRKAYQSDLAHFSEFLGIDLSQIENDQWQMIDRSLFAAYKEHLDDLISEKTSRPYSSATKARKLTAIRELLTEATYSGLYSRDDLEYIKQRLGQIEVTHNHHPGISPGDQEAILKAASEQDGLKGERDYLIFRVLLETGMRRAELTGLKVRHLSIAEGVPRLTIEHGKGDKLRSIPIERDTYNTLQDWLKLSSQGESDDNPIFCRIALRGTGEAKKYQAINPDKHLSGNAIAYILNRCIIAAGIESKITPHSFRVAMVTDAIAGDAPLPHVQRITGHKDTRMLTDVYNRHEFNQPISEYRKRKVFKPYKKERQ